MIGLKNEMEIIESNINEAVKNFKEKTKKNAVVLKLEEKEGKYTIIMEIT